MEPSQLQEEIRRDSPRDEPATRLHSALQPVLAASPSTRPVVSRIVTSFPADPPSYKRPPPSAIPSSEPLQTPISHGSSPASRPELPRKLLVVPYPQSPHSRSPEGHLAEPTKPLRIKKLSPRADEPSVFGTHALDGRLLSPFIGAQPPPSEVVETPPSMSESRVLHWLQQLPTTPNEFVPVPFANRNPPSSSHQPIPQTVNRPPPGTPTLSAPSRKDAAYPRPNADDVYKRLEDFFSPHDLDQPADPPTPTAAVEIWPNPNPRHTKRLSIRVVAAERQKRVASAGGAHSTIDIPALPRTHAPQPREGVNDFVQVSPPVQKTPRPRTHPKSAGKFVFTLQVLTYSHTVLLAVKFRWLRGELVGQGTFGQVYMALNATSGEIIAVKQAEIPQSRSDRENSRQLAVMEAIRTENDILQRLSHPHIVEYLGYEETPAVFSM